MNRDNKSTLVYASSLNRNTTTYPKVNSFKTNFREITGVTSVYLCKAVLPKAINILDNPVLFLRIKRETRTNLVSENWLTNHLVFPMFLEDNNNSSFIFGKDDCDDPLFLQTPEDFSELFIEILDQQGNAYDFGEADGSLDTSEQVSVLLKFNHDVKLWGGV